MPMLRKRSGDDSNPGNEILDLLFRFSRITTLAKGHYPVLTYNISQDQSDPSYIYKIS